MPCLITNTECATVSEIQRLREIVSKLRAPDGCPWDREQTHHSLLRCLIEEVSEVIEAIDNQDDILMEEELGDLLLQVVMHSCLAEERGVFDLEKVAQGISDKLIRRHPHVFDKDAQEVTSSDEVIDRWDQIKEMENKNKETSGKKNTIFKKLPPKLPALLFASDVYKKVVKHNLESSGQWSNENVDELTSGLNEEVAGRMLFEIVASCRHKKIDPESALRKYSASQMEHFDGEKYS